MTHLPAAQLGGSVNRVHHLYHWPDYDARDQACSVDGTQPDWKQLRDKLTSTRSLVMVEATACLNECGLPGAQGYASPSAVAGDERQVAWELRTYQLVLGYTTVPTFLELYSAGLKDKLAADDSGASQLATLLYSDCGPLNLVMELWRHESLQRSQDSRQASRKASKWRDAVNDIAKIAHSFDTQFMRPLPGSPWH